MSELIVISLIGGCLAVVGLFSLVGPRRAVLAGSVGGLLFLPVTGIEIPGFPGVFDKYASVYLGCLAGVLLFDCSALARLRPRWFDLPIVAFVCAPMISSLSNGLGAYDGASEVARHSILYGLPYLFGRIYLRDTKAIHELAVAIILGAIVYVPLCLWEIRMSPQLHATLFDVVPVSFAHYFRSGTYRPIVFMQNPLMVGMWMTAAAISAYWLGRTRPGARWLGLPLGVWALLPACITVVGKTFGAASLMLAGIATLWISCRSRQRILFACLMAAAVLYPGFRATGFVSATDVTRVASAVYPETRVISLAYRLRNEDVLAAHAMKRPWFGWGSWGRNRPQGESTVTDGLWIIALGENGVLGLAAIELLFLMPGLILLWTTPAASWNRREIAPVVALSVVMSLYWIDCLANAFVNPVFVTAVGGLNTCLANTKRHRRLSGCSARRLELGDARFTHGRTCRVSQAAATD